MPLRTPPIPAAQAAAMDIRPFEFQPLHARANVRQTRGESGDAMGVPRDPITIVRVPATDALPVTAPRPANAFRPSDAETPAGASGIDVQEVGEMHRKAVNELARLSELDTLRGRFRRRDADERDAALPRVETTDGRVGRQAAALIAQVRGEPAAASAVYTGPRTQPEKR